MNAKQRTAARLAKIKRNEDILSLYSKGTALRNMAELLEVSQATIFRVLADNDIELKGNRHFNNDTVLRAVELYNQPENSIKYILSQTGIKSEQTLYRYLSEQNVPLRKQI